MWLNGVGQGVGVVLPYRAQEKTGSGQAPKQYKNGVGISAGLSLGPLITCFPHP